MGSIQLSLFGRTSWELLYREIGWILEPSSNPSVAPKFQCLSLNGQKSKEEINSILSSSSIPKETLDKIEQNAKAEYPDDYTLQKAYIKGAIKTYNDLKK